MNDWVTNACELLVGARKAPVRIEVVKGELSLPAGPYHVFAINPDGTRGEEIPTRTENGKQFFSLGTIPTLCYELERRK